MVNERRIDMYRGLRVQGGPTMIFCDACSRFGRAYNIRVRTNEMLTDVRVMNWSAK
jgi:hypothetical protein